MDARDYPKIEEVLRLLATAVNSVRLYPASSDLPQQAIDRLVERSNEVTAELGTVRLLVDPRAFRLGESKLAGTHSHSTGLAEALHAMQVGQLVIAPGLQHAEAAAFAAVASRDPRDVRSTGGARAALAAAGASTIAVIEVSLRTSAEEGLAGVDLINAPLDEVASETLAAASRWHHGTKTGDAVDEVASSVAALEVATRDLAMSRIATALLRLSEEERVRVLLSAMTADAAGKPMRGMLQVIARMSPATIARLLSMASARCGARPHVLAMPLELPPETARELAALLTPSPRTEAECGVPADAAVESMAAEALEPDDGNEIARMKDAADQTKAGRALVTTIAVVRDRADADSVRALADALGPAARSGALTVVREALRILDGLSPDHRTALEIERARAILAEPETLAEACHAVTTDADAAIAGELLASAGATGARVLLVLYARADATTRSLFRPSLRSMSEQVAAAASLALRSDDTATVLGSLSALPDLGERASLPVVTGALEHLDIEVRRRAVTALTEMNGSESRRVLAKALSHWDPETGRWAVRETGRLRVAEAIPALVRIVGDINVFERNHELKKEVIKCLEAIGSKDALPVLTRLSRRRFAFGRKNRELRFQALRAVERLAANGEPPKESMHRD
ncbi:MAG TPA: HEAT repeat domain-containing protein [Coriobacteriia bacterium]|nr:HEAT repeat domain-containing protein [Coriobacteriia bacterium]